MLLRLHKLFVWICKKLYRKPKFKKWIILEEAYGKIFNKARDRENVADAIYDYLSLALFSFKWDKIEWEYLADLLHTIFLVNTIETEFPFLAVTKKRSSEVRRKTYDGWYWYTWSNLLASSYGWTLDYIAKLDVEEGIGLIQELLIDEQYRKAWEWHLSDKSVGYDKSTKEPKIIEWKFPEWMMETVSPHRKAKPVKIIKSMIPAGVIVRDKFNVEH